jgi:hypothetical protein
MELQAVEWLDKRIEEWDHSIGLGPDNMPVYPDQPRVYMILKARLLFCNPELQAIVEALSPFKHEELTKWLEENEGR